MVAEHVSTTRTHPLTPLSGSEIERVVAAIRASQTDAAGLRFVQVDLLEPRKVALLAMTAGSGPVPERIALAVLFDRAGHQADQGPRLASSRHVVPGLQKMLQWRRSPSELEPLWLKRWTMVRTQSPWT